MVGTRTISRPSRPWATRPPAPATCTRSGSSPTRCSPGVVRSTPARPSPLPSPRSTTPAAAAGRRPRGPARRRRPVPRQGPEPAAAQSSAAMAAALGHTVPGLSSAVEGPLTDPQVRCAPVPVRRSAPVRRHRLVCRPAPRRWRSHRRGRRAHRRRCCRQPQGPSVRVVSWLGPRPVRQALEGRRESAGARWESAGPAGRPPAGPPEGRPARRAVRRGRGRPGPDLAMVVRRRRDRPGPDRLLPRQLIGPVAAPRSRAGTTYVTVYPTTTTGSTTTIPTTSTATTTTTTSGRPSSWTSRRTCTGRRPRWSPS